MFTSRSTISTELTAEGKAKRDACEAMSKMISVKTFPLVLAGACVLGRSVVEGYAPSSPAAASPLFTSRVGSRPSARTAAAPASPIRTPSQLNAAAASAATGKSGGWDDADAPPLRRHKPRKIALMVEPTPFTHVSGYANRFNEMLKFLAKAGDDVKVLTVDGKTDQEKLPTEKFGFSIDHTQGFTFPLYNHITLTFDLPEMKGAKIMEKFKPDLIHVTSP
jgi:hypothetical protein